MQINLIVLLFLQTAKWHLCDPFVLASCILFRSKSVFKHIHDQKKYVLSLPLPGDTYVVVDDQAINLCIYLLAICFLRCCATVNHIELLSICSKSSALLHAFCCSDLFALGSFTQRACFVLLARTKFRNRNIPKMSLYDWYLCRIYTLWKHNGATLLYPTLSSPTLPIHTLPYPYPTHPYPTLPYPTQPIPTPPYPTLIYSY